MQENTEISAKQARAVSALLTCRNIDEAARGARVSVRTLYNWLQTDAAFRAAVRDAKSRVIESAERRLIAGQEQALDTLQALMSSAESESVRRQAALDWLNMLLRYRDMGDIDERLTALEQAVLHGK